MDKTLYLSGKELGRYSPKALELDGLTTKALEKIFKGYLDQGYSAREISHIMQSAVSMLEAESFLKGKSSDYHEPEATQESPLV